MPDTAQLTRSRYGRLCVVVWRDACQHPEQVQAGQSGLAPSRTAGWASRRGDEIRVVQSVWEGDLAENAGSCMVIPAGMIKRIVSLATGHTIKRLPEWRD